MLGPVSGTGRAMMASLQQAIQKGMPPDQAVQYVKSMATQGVAPLTDLYAMMNQFQRMKQQPVQAPQTPPTIRDQLNMAEKQQAQQQMAMQQGLGGMPAPAMEQAQFAGGGIVAFSQGGLTAEEEAEFEKLQDLMAEGITPRGGMSPFGGASPSIIASSPAVGGLQSLYEKRFKELRAKKEAAKQAEIQAGRQAAIAAEAEQRGISLPKPVVAQTAVPTKPPVVERTAPPRTDTTSRVGIGSRVPAAPTVAAPAEKEKSLEDFLTPFREAGKPLREATDAYRQFLDKDEASAKEQGGRDRMLALAQAGFGMAEAASKPGATFLGSAAAAGGNFAKNMMQVNREADAAKRGIVKERLALAQAEASGNKADTVAAYQNLNNYQNRLTKAAEFKEEMDLKRAGLAVESNLGFARINAELMNRDMLAGFRRDEATARAADRAQQLRVDVAKLAYPQINALRTTSVYIKASPEERLSMEQAEFGKAAAVLGTNMGIGVSGGGGMSDAVRAADMIVGGTG